MHTSHGQTETQVNLHLLASLFGQAVRVQRIKSTLVILFVSLHVFFFISFQSSLTNQMRDLQVPVPLLLKSLKNLILRLVLREEHRVSVPEQGVCHRH